MQAVVNNDGATKGKQPSEGKMIDSKHPPSDNNRGDQHGKKKKKFGNKKKGDDKPHNKEKENTDHNHNSKGSKQGKDNNGEHKVEIMEKIDLSIPSKPVWKKETIASKVNTTTLF